MRELNLKQAELSSISNEVLERGGLFCFKAHGSSMYPFIRDGDILTIQPVEIETLAIGDVAFYRSTWDRVIAHRVVAKKFTNGKRVLIMRGDSGSHTNEQVQPDHVLGRVMSIQRGEEVIRLDNTFRKLTSRLWITSYPLSALFLRAVLRIKRKSFFLLKLLASK
jgi:signal peptidase